MTTAVSHSNHAISTAVYAGPDRYAGDWRAMFAAQYEPYLKDNITILDVGSGRAPAIPKHQRPKDCRYIGLDISATELALAPSGSYDEVYVHDLAEPVSDLLGQVDVIVSWQVLEHVKPLSTAVNNVRSYLKPRGHFIALLSGRYAAFALLNRVIPERVGVLAMKYLLKRPPDSVFRAHYDACTYSDLTRIFSNWSHATVVPVYRGSIYFRFAKPMAALYMRYENWIAGTGRSDLATHYVILAEK